MPIFQVLMMEFKRRLIRYVRMGSKGGERWVGSISLPKEVLDSWVSVRDLALHWDGNQLIVVPANNED